MTAEAEARAPVLGIRRDKPQTPLLESLRLSLLFVEPLEPIEGEIGAIRGARHQAVPGRLGALEIALDEADVAEIQVGRRRVRILLDRRLEMPRRVAAIADAAAPRCRARSRGTPGSTGCAAGCLDRSARRAACGCDARPPTDAVLRGVSAGRAGRTGSAGSMRITSLNASSARSTNPPRLKSRPRHSRM